MNEAIDGDATPAYVNQDPDQAALDAKVQERAAWIAGMHQMIGWYAAHPEVPLPGNKFSNYNFNPDDKNDVAGLIRTGGKWEKQYSGGMLYLKRSFGSIEVTFPILRASICTAKVVGTKVIPSTYIPERVEDVLEWSCEPILGDDNAE